MKKAKARSPICIRRIAMRIGCPYCGTRDAAEFIYRGDRAAAAPAPEDDEAAFAQVYLRDNPAGPLRELWYHAQGCRNWLTVTRDTLTHQISGALLTREEPR